MDKLTFAVMLFTGLSASAAALPTDSFRKEHAEIRTHLEHVRTWAGNLGATPDERRATMKKIVGFFQEHIAPHAGWEEKKLYPAVDRRAGGRAHPFTSTMRHEHTIVARWIDELAKLAAAPQPDAVAFQRRTDNLLGLLDAHFEEEEQVLLPILDKTMKPADFEREIGHPE